MNTAIIPAAGQGRRMGGTRAKQFLELSGEPILVHTLRRFEECPEIGSCVVAVPDGETAYVLEIASRAGIRKLARVVPGGATRQESIARALATVRPEGAGIVAVHDAVRPLVRPELISEVVRAAETHGAAILAVAASDTVKQVRDGVVEATIERERIWLAQTPQAFRFDVLRQAYERAAKEGWSVTDDSSLVERTGQKVVVVAGSVLNLKITMPEDIALAEFILSSEFVDDRRGSTGGRRRTSRRI